MLARVAGFARWNLVLFAAGFGVPVALSACSDDGAASDQSTGEAPSGSLTVLAQYEGGYDGEHFWYRPMAIDGQGVGGSSGDGIGTARQAVESQVNNAFYTPATGGAGGAGGAAPQTNAVLIEQMEFHDQTTWNTATCGPTPTNGSCVRWRLFNAFADSDLFRGYFYLTNLAPPTGCGAGCNITVGIPAPAAGNQTSTPDVGLLGVTPASGTFGAPGLWRYGLLERSGPEPRGRERWLAFTGSGTDPNTGKWGFHWIGQVRGTLVKPTIRGSLANNTQDKAPFYTSIGTATAGMLTGSDIQSTADGRYVVFSSNSTSLSPQGAAAGYKVFRYDTTTGALVVASVATGATNAPAGCTSTNASISANGSRVVFQSSGCDLGFGSGAVQIYLRDITAGTTTLVSHDSASLTTLGNHNSQTPRIAAAGGFVTFVSAAGNIFAARPADRLGRYNDVYRYTVGSGLIERANIGTSGAGFWPNISQSRPDISSNGARVVFETAAQVLVAADRAVNTDVFMYTFGSGISMLSVRQSGILNPSSSCYLPTISADGNFAAFACATGGSDFFVGTPAATAGRLHIYRRATGSAPSLTMIDTAPSGTEANASAGAVPPALNNDGTLVGYLSTATNLLRTAACNTPSGACMPVPATFPNVFMRDISSPDPEVQRSFLVSQIRSKVNTAAQPYAAALSGISVTNNSRTLSVVGTRDTNAGAVYLASGGNSADWGQLPGNGGWQIYVSPFSDALFQ